MTTTAKSEKKIKAQALGLASGKPIHTMVPWSYGHRDGRVEISAYIMATGALEVVAGVEHGKNVDAEATASFIVRAVNDHEKMQNTIEELVSALELCLQRENVTWEIEHEAETVLRRAKQGGNENRFFR
jgi:hypothetical protein